jgi:hypothetical protein
MLLLCPFVSPFNNWSAATVVLYDYFMYRSGTARKTARVFRVVETNEIENGMGVGGR